MKPLEQPVHLARGRRVAEDGKPERGLGDEDVARDRFERGAGGIGPAFIVAGHDDPLALMVEDDLGRAEDVAGGHEADVDLADPDHFAISDRPPRLGTVAAFHDREGLGRGDHLAMAAAGMIGMAVGDQGERFGLGGIDPGVCRPDVDAFGKRLYPGTETRHHELYG